MAASKADNKAGPGPGEGAPRAESPAAPVRRTRPREPQPQRGASLAPEPGKPVAAKPTGPVKPAAELTKVAATAPQQGQPAPVQGAASAQGRTAAKQGPKPAAATSEPGSARPGPDAAGGTDPAQDQPDAAPTPAPLVVVANRLPVEYVPAEGWRRAPGGLVSAMEAVLRDRDTTWVGWTGRSSDAAVDPDAAVPPPLPDRVGRIDLVEVELTTAEVAGHYEGFSNGALWPLYHRGIVPPVYHRSQFETYRSINSRFAIQVAERAPQGAMVWVQDYQLQLVPAMLRRHRPDLRIGFFLHIPFPPAELFVQLPWRRAIIEGLLGADVIGFQTQQDAANFRALAQRLVGAGLADANHLVVHDPQGTREALATAFPIGIRAADFADLAASPQIQDRAKQIRVELGNPKVMMLGVDRLDYTKGIDVRIRAVTELLLDAKLDPATTAFLQIANPSRDNVEEYRKIRDEVELLVSRVNGDIGKLGNYPIHYMHQNMAMDELVAMYVAADVMLVTPLCDGMNLVAKEYVACRTESDGVLVLSEFTGAAAQMTEAWLVNPYDIEGTKEQILAAVNASGVEIHTRMEHLRHGVFSDDVAKWAKSFLAALEAPQPQAEEGSGQ